MHLLQQQNPTNANNAATTTNINNSGDIATCDNNANSNVNINSSTNINIDVDVDINAKVAAITLADVLQQPILVGRVFLSLGSNHNACQYLAYAREVLNELGQMWCSPELVNPDFTASAAQPKPDYTNQCILLSLSTPVPPAEFLAMMATIEQDCQRQRQPLSTVSSSGDNTNYNHNSSTNTSGVASVASTSKNRQTEKKSNSAKLVTLDIDLLAIQPLQQNIWYRLAERYPFKAHELYGMRALKMAEILS